jgi:hypothetical protein
MRIAAIALAAILAMTGAAPAQYSTAPNRTTTVPPSSVAPSKGPYSNYDFDWVGEGLGAIA